MNPYWIRFSMKHGFVKCWHVSWADWKVKCILGDNFSIYASVRGFVVSAPVDETDPTSILSFAWKWFARNISAALTKCHSSSQLCRWNDVWWGPSRVSTGAQWEVCGESRTTIKTSIAFAQDCKKWWWRNFPWPLADLIFLSRIRHNFLVSSLVPCGW